MPQCISDREYENQSSNNLYDEELTVERKLNPLGAESVQNFGIFLNFNFQKTVNIQNPTAMKAYRGTKQVKNHLFLV